MYSGFANNEWNEDDGSDGDNDSPSLPTILILSIWINKKSSSHVIKWKTFICTFIKVIFFTSNAPPRLQTYFVDYWQNVRPLYGLGTENDPDIQEPLHKLISVIYIFTKESNKVSTVSYEIT